MQLRSNSSSKDISCQRVNLGREREQVTAAGMSAKPSITSGSLPSTSATTASSSPPQKQQQQQPDSPHPDTPTSVGVPPHHSKPKPSTWPFKVSPITFVLPSTPNCDLHDTNPNPETRELDIRYKTRYSTKEFSISNSKFRQESVSNTSLSKEKNHEKKLLDKIHTPPPHNVEMVTPTSNNLCMPVEENKINSALERLIQEAVINCLDESSVNEFETAPSTGEKKANTLDKSSPEKKTISSQVNMKKEKPIVEIWNHGGIIHFKGGFKKLVIRFKNELASEKSVVDGNSRREDTAGCFNGDVCSLPAELLAAVRDAPINVGENAKQDGQCNSLDGSVVSRFEDECATFSRGQLQDGQCNSRDGSVVPRCEDECATSSRGQLLVDFSGIQCAHEFVEDGLGMASGLSSATRTDQCWVEKVGVNEGSFGANRKDLRLVKGDELKIEAGIGVEEGSCGVMEETGVRVREGSCGVKEETGVRVREGSCGVKEETGVRARGRNCGVKEEADIRVREGSCGVKEETGVRVRGGNCGVKEEADIRVREGSCGVGIKAGVGERSCEVKCDVLRRVVADHIKAEVGVYGEGYVVTGEALRREEADEIEAEVGVDRECFEVTGKALRLEEANNIEAVVDGEGYEVTGEALRRKEADEIEAGVRISEGSCRASNEAEFSGWGKSSGILSEALRLKKPGEFQIEAGVDPRVLVSKLTSCDEDLKELQKIDESVGEVELKDDDLWSHCDVSERRDEMRTNLGEVSECVDLDFRIVNVCNFIQPQDIDFVDDSQETGLKEMNYVNSESIQEDEGLRIDEDDDESDGKNDETGVWSEVEEDAKRGDEMGADEGLYADVSEDVYRYIVPSGEACRLAVEDFESNSHAHEDDLDTVAMTAKLADTREESSVVVDYSLLDVQRLTQKICQETRKMNKLISKYKLRVVKVGLLQSYMEQLKEQRDEMARMLLGVDRETVELRNDAAELRCTVAAVCDTSVANIGKETDARRLEPACFRRYTNIRTSADASNALSSVRTRIEALNDLEVLVYRKLITMSHMLPSMHQEKIPHVKGHRFSSGRNREQIPRSISARSSGVIRVLSDFDNAPDIIALPDSSITLSTPLAIDSDGAGSEGYLPGPDE